MVRPKLSSGESLDAAPTHPDGPTENAANPFHVCLPQQLLANISSSPEKPVPDLLNSTFHSVDKELANLATQTGTSSGCTAAVAFLRVEDDAGSKGDQASSEDTAPAAEGTTERAQSGTGLWGKISKRFESSDHAEQAQPRQAPKRVLYTANVGDTRAVLW